MASARAPACGVTRPRGTRLQLVLLESFSGCDNREPTGGAPAGTREGVRAPQIQLNSKYPLPSLLLLDLKMPGTDGFEVMRWIKTRPELTSLRIVTLTSSENVRDMDVAYKLGASSFLVKSIDFENTAQLAKTMAEFWL